MSDRTMFEPKGQLIVIGVGLMRTGTNSLKVALETLYGQPCYHMKELFNNHGHYDAWFDIANDLISIKKQSPNATLSYERFTNIFSGYRCTTDIPSCLFYEEFLQIYPEAKFVLTLRDEISWLRSLRSTISKKRPLLSSPGEYIMNHITGRNKRKRMVHRCLEYKFKEVKYDDDEYWIDIYRKHIEMVKSCIPEEKLLLFNPEDGWEPLCKFLNVPIPDSIYPHVNTSEEINRYFLKINSPAKWINFALLSTGFLITIGALLGFRKTLF